MRCATSMYRFCKSTKLTKSLRTHLLAIEVESKDEEEEEEEEQRLRLVRTKEFSVWEIVEKKRKRWYREIREDEITSELAKSVLREYRSSYIPRTPFILYLSIAIVHRVRGIADSRQWCTFNLLRETETRDEIEKRHSHLFSSIDKALFKTLFCKDTSVLRMLLNMRTTEGTLRERIMLPPTRELLRAFDAYHTVDGHSVLSVGARALAKHCKRSKKGWWGTCKGSEMEKNECSHSLAVRMIRDAVWINIHGLPHEVSVLEIRVKEGYGLRWAVRYFHDSEWTCIVEQFRGFLEPPMSDGHEKGWHHD